jgi:hypothetical protein
MRQYLTLSLSLASTKSDDMFCSDCSRRAASTRSCCAFTCNKYNTCQQYYILLSLVVHLSRHVHDRCLVVAVVRVAESERRFGRAQKNIQLAVLLVQHLLQLCLQYIRMKKQLCFASLRNITNKTLCICILFLSLLYLFQAECVCEFSSCCYLTCCRPSQIFYSNASLHRVQRSALFVHTSLNE